MIWMALDGKFFRLADDESCCVPSTTSLPRASGTGAGADVRRSDRRLGVGGAPGVPEVGGSKASVPVWLAEGTKKDIGVTKL